MSPAPKPPSKQKVQATAPIVSTVEPPAPGGWQLKTSFGFMSADGTPSGRLVRLADVLRWIEDTQSVPRAAAVKVFFEAMPPEIMQWLYWVQPSDYAKPVPPEYGFGFKSAEQIEQAKAVARQNALQKEWESQSRSFEPGWRFQGATMNGGQISLSEPQPTEPGFPALFRVLERWWKQTKFLKTSTVDILDDPHNSLRLITTLSILLDKAVEIWGYGRVLAVVESSMETFDDLAKYRKANPTAKWNPKQREILANYAKANNHIVGIKKKIGAALGTDDTPVSRTTIDKRIQEHYEAKKEKALRETNPYMRLAK